MSFLPFLRNHFDLLLFKINLDISGSLHKSFVPTSLLYIMLSPKHTPQNFPLRYDHGYLTNLTGVHVSEGD